MSDTGIYELTNPKPQVIEKLSLKAVSDDMKHRLVNEITRNYCIKPEVLAIEYYSEWQQKVSNKTQYNYTNL